MMTTDEIRRAFLDHFREDGHMILESAPLVPARHDPSVLLTTAGMHPLKPWFLAEEEPPATELASCQKCFRTTDIEQIGLTARHLTFFEMLGNFSIGAYFKQGAIERAWTLATGALGLDPDRIWVTVFAGDDSLGVGQDSEAIAIWERIGVPSERIIPLGRSDNFWQAGPTGPCGPCSELYYDRGAAFGPDDERPGDDGERFLEFWNLVFMQYEQTGETGLGQLPSRNIDTGMGLNRMAALLQEVDSVYETDQFVPLMDLGDRISTGDASPRSLRILADHSRAMCFLIADGVVPSNEERGYILRRLMRRAILHGRRCGMEPGFLRTYAEVVERTMSDQYPELREQRDAIGTWLDGEEEAFGRTLESGTELLDRLVEDAKRQGSGLIPAGDAFLLHDTHGFPIDLTSELAAEQGLEVDHAGFEALMEEQRSRARGGTTGGKADAADSELSAAARRLAAASRPVTFVGYDTLELETEVLAVASGPGGEPLIKLAESPFYAKGGGQVADRGDVSWDGVRAVVIDVLREGDDQVIMLGAGSPVPEPGATVVASVDRPLRHATASNHTATHLLHAALRERLGGHVRQAGSSVAPDKLRFDFTHGEALSTEDITAIEDRINQKILDNEAVGTSTMSLDEAKSLGAMALFGEKYGDEVRMVEIGSGDWSRELCGGTHVGRTAEIGVFRLLAESSSAANVRRIEAITGPAAIALLRSRDAELSETAKILKTEPELVPAQSLEREQRIRELERAAAQGAAADADALLADAEEISGGALLAAVVEVADHKQLPDLVDRLRAKLGEHCAVVLAATGPERVSITAGVGSAWIERGVKAGDLVAAAAGEVGGGGGGRDSMARAGGRNPERVGQALAAARTKAISALGS